MGETLAKRLFRLRDARRWSQADLGVRSKVGQPVISRIESGRTQNPDSDTLAAIATALDVSERYLRVGDEYGVPAAPTGPTRPGPSPAPPRPPIPEPAEDEFMTDLERALFGAMDPEKYEPRDFFAALAALHAQVRAIRRDVDKAELGERYLVAAKQLRIEGLPTEPGDVAGRVASSRNPHVAKREADAAERDQQEAEADARARGGEPGARADIGARIAKNLASGKRKTPDEPDEH